MAGFVTFFTHFVSPVASQVCLAYDFAAAT
jgi:hypothetical protein